MGFMPDRDRGIGNKIAGLLFMFEGKEEIIRKEYEKSDTGVCEPPSYSRMRSGGFVSGATGSGFADAAQSLAGD
jgi:hypothetical protein